MMKRGAAYIVILCVSLAAPRLQAQVEHVPQNHPVYEFLDRLGVKGVLPAFSASMVPLERREVIVLLDSAWGSRSSLGDIDMHTLEKYRSEFSLAAGTRADQDWVVIGPGGAEGEGVGGLVDQKHKYLVAFVDSFATFYGEVLGSAEYRSLHGDSRGNVDARLMSIGGRFYGTIAGRLGYLLQSTNGVFSGDRSFERIDPHLATNMKLNENAQSSNYDETQAYLRLSFGWAGVQFGREYTALGVGYAGRLMLSDDAPVFDALRFDAHYKGFRFIFMHGSLLKDPRVFPGLWEKEPAEATKYMALHRFQFSLCKRLNLSANEMVIYQRHAPEFAYLIPVNFFKSAEHSLRDRDNAIIMFDAEYFPAGGYKLYGSWLIDDIDFSRMGSGWWGNEFGWQAGAYVADIVGLQSCDALIEYTHIEPYVYSNRIAGNDYSHSGIGLGHRLDPNTDELLGEVRVRFSDRLRTRLHYAYSRHGQNVMVGDSVVRNVGGSLLQGHRDGDSETARFLDGDRVNNHRIGMRIDYEPITDLFVTGNAEWNSASTTVDGLSRRDLALSVQLRIEY
jgi:hypothetical protein